MTEVKINYEKHLAHMIDTCVEKGRVNQGPCSKGIPCVVYDTWRHLQIALCEEPLISSFIRAGPGVSGEVTAEAVIPL